MNFLLPAGLFLGLFVPLVILLYLLKLRRVDTPVASTLLWKRSLEDLRANAPFQKLKRNLLLFLQLLIIILLTLAAARPVLRLGDLRGRSVILLLDQSASMKATDVPPSRFEEARKRALSLVNGMGAGDSMMIVGFSAGARVLSPFERDAARLRAALAAAQPTDNPSRIGEAAQIARQAGELHANPEIVILSDGNFAIPAESPLGALNTRYIPVGTSGENLGIVDLVARGGFGENRQTQILAGVLNAGSEEREVYLELFGAADPPADATGAGLPAAPARELLDAYRLAIAPGARETVIFKDPGTYPRAIELRLDGGDALGADDRAWAVLPSAEPVSVLLVTDGNPYLERVLNLDRRTLLSTVPTGGYTGPGDFDIVIFDSFSPPLLANGNYVFVNAIPPMEEWTAGETVAFPNVVDWDRFHPLNRYVNFENLTVREARNLGAPAWADVIAEARETPLIAAFRRERIRGLVIGFDLYDSNWPRRVSFPVFFANLVDWFAGEAAADQAARRTGDVLALDPPETATGPARLIRPGGRVEEIEFPDASPRYAGGIDEIGVYRFAAGETELRRFAVNLLSEEESRIAPRESLETGGAAIEGEREAPPQNREIWRLLAILAFLFLTAEWFAYTRRARRAA